MIKRNNVHTSEEVVELFKEHYEKQDYCFYNLKPFLKEKGLIEEEFKVGKWYKGSRNYGWLVYFEEITKGQQVIGYGICTDDGIYEGRFEGDVNSYGWVKATDKEVEEALIKEAKKRGFKEGVKFISVMSGFKCLCEGVLNYHSDYLGEKDVLFYDHNIIFHKGKWAEIVEEKKELTVSEIEEELGYGIKIIK
jgi:hypothetical protein